MNVLSEQVKRFWQNMFLLEEAALLELNQFERVASEKYWSIYVWFWFVCLIFVLSKQLQLWAECAADGAPELCSATPEMPVRAVWARAPPQPLTTRPSPFQREKPPEPPSPSSECQTCPFAGSASLGAQQRSGTGSGRAAGPRGRAREASVTGREPRGAAAMPLGRVALPGRSQLARASAWGPAGEHKNKAREEDSWAAERGEEEEEGLLLFAVASFAPKFLPQWAACLRRQLWPRSTWISCLRFLRASPSPAGRPGDAMLLGKSQPPSAAVFRSAALESSLLGMALEEAALCFHLYPKA